MTKTPSKLDPKPLTWGNTWTEEKLNVFQKYVKAYLTIMDTQKKRWGWKTLYFDGFAGSGDRIKNDVDTEGMTNSLLSDLGIEEVETDVYKGSAERVLSLKKEFDYYYFIDSNEDSLKKLKERLSSFDLNYRHNFRSGDANKYIGELATALRRDTSLKALVLLDPFGMQINWESIELLRDTSTDIWILVPSGVIINRLLDKKGELKNINKLCSFFGMTEDDIRKEFYDEVVTDTLFGKIVGTTKKRTPIRKIADLYIKRLGGIWKYVTPEPLIMKNTKNIEIFHFVFASQVKVGFKIAKNIIESATLYD